MGIRATHLAVQAWIRGAPVNRAPAQLASGSNPKREKALRHAARTARVQVQHGIELRIIEPWGRGLSAQGADEVFTHLHESARAAAAAERTLKHGGPAGRWAVELAHDTAERLNAVAEVLRTGESPPTLPPAPEVLPDPDDDVGLLLRHSAVEAHAALQSLVRAAHAP